MNSKNTEMFGLPIQALSALASLETGTLKAYLNSLIASIKNEKNQVIRIKLIQRHTYLAKQLIMRGF